MKYEIVSGKREIPNDFAFDFKYPECNLTPKNILTYPCTYDAYKAVCNFLNISIQWGSDTNLRLSTLHDIYDTI